MQCLISSIACAIDGILCEQEVSNQKKLVYLRKQIELNQRACRLDQNTVTMALRIVFYSLSLSTLTHGVTQASNSILIDSNIAHASYQY